MQEIFKRFQDEVSPDPVDLKVVGAWAIANRLWHPRPIDFQSRFARDMADCLREEYRTDKAGRRYRSKMPVTDGRQGSLWGDIDTAPRKHVEKNIAQRRRQIVGDCYQLETDRQHYNSEHSDEEQLRLILDFTDDVQERLIAAGIVDKKAA